jgi:hypothetical protein
MKLEYAAAAAAAVRNYFSFYFEAGVSTILKMFHIKVVDLNEVYILSCVKIFFVVTH